jgi:4-amino-4-deoxy-L-arabinose transferase-like glycosyltransferase
MREVPRFQLVDFLLLLIVLAVAAVARVGYVWEAADRGQNSGPLQVQGHSPFVQKELLSVATPRGQENPTELDVLVENLKTDEEFKGPAPLSDKQERTAHTAPGYPFLVAMLERAPLLQGPVDPILRWIQCGLGSLTAVFYFLLGRRCFRSLFVGTLAGLLCAANPFWIINCAEINDGTLTAFLLALALLLGARASQAGGALTSLVFGLTLAGLPMVRASMLPFSFVAVFWFLLRCRLLPRGWLYALLAFLGFANGLAPWTMRNFQVFNEVVPITDTAMLHLYIGSNPNATGGPQTEKEVLNAVELTHDLPETGSLRKQLAAQKQTERYNQLGEDLFKFAVNHPVDVVGSRLRAGVYFFLSEKFFKEPKKTQLCLIDDRLLDEAPGWLSSNFEIALASFLFGMLLLGVLGWRWTYGWRKEGMPASLAVMWVALPYILGHAELLHGPRLPIDGVLLTYAAFALSCVIPSAGIPLLRGSAVSASASPSSPPPPPPSPAKPKIRL